MTSEGHVVGTPHYLAPELLESALEATPRTDVYSLGLVLFELLTGELPHAGGDNIQVLWYRRLSEDPPNPAQVAPAAEIPAELADCVQRMLAVEPGERPGELGDIRAVIEQSLGGSG